MKKVRSHLLGHVGFLIDLGRSLLEHYGESSDEASPSNSPPPPPPFKKARNNRKKKKLYEKVKLPDKQLIICCDGRLEQVVLRVCAP